MTAPRYATLASKLLVRHDAAAGPGPSPDARTEAIARVASVLSAKGRRRRTARWAAVCAAALAATVAVADGAQHLRGRGLFVATSQAPASARSVQIVAHPLGGGASVVVSGSPAPLADGRQLADGSRLVTPAGGRATLAFSTGTRVMLGEATDVTVNGDAAMQVLRLGAGWVGLQVAKVGPGQRFLVDTGDAEVEVRGTQFQVSLVRPDPQCGRGTPTRVSVSEGVVTVRQGGAEVRVAAGEQWPAGCDRTTGPVGIQARGAGAAAPVRAAGQGSGSSLADQNDIFAQALEAKRQGDAHAALAAFDRFLAKYPSGPLAENAWVERLRLVRLLAPSRAPVAAEQYIATYPHGFARAEAEAIVAGTL